MKKGNLAGARIIHDCVDRLQRLRANLSDGSVIIVAGERLDFSFEFHLRVSEAIEKIIGEELKLLDEEIETL